MNIYALIPLLGVFVYAALFSMALRHRHKRERRIFTLYLAAAGIWSFVSFVLHLENSFFLQYTLPGSRVLILMLIWWMLTYYLFIRTFVQKPVGREIYLGSAFILIVALLASLELVPRGAYAENGVLYIDNGAFLYLYAFFGASLAGVSAYLLVQHYKQANTSQARTRITYLMIGLSVLTVTTLTNLSDSLAIYPVDHLGNLANALIISYAILKHQLLDIRVVIQRGLVYTVLSVGITSVYLLVLFGAQALFHSSGYASLALATVVALAMALIFAPLRNLTQERVDRLLFREMYEYRRMLVNFRNNVSNALDLEQLAYDILDPLTDTLHARWSALLLSDVDSGDFRVRFARQKDTEDRVSGLRLRRSSPLLSLLAHEQGVLHEELLDTYPEGLALWEAERHDLKTYGVDLLCPMVSRGSLAGVLLLGGKQSGRTYSDEDQGLVLTMASGAALALDNARMLDDLKRQQHREDELLSQMVQAQEHERERVALELHDGVAQWLVRASYQAQICKALLAREDSADIQSELNEVEGTVDESLRELRRVLAGLRPPTLDELGLTHALRHEAEELKSNGVSCRVEMEVDAVRLSSSVEIAVYRIVQEALNNVRKHARATQATLRLHFGEEHLRVEIIDDGRGFNVARILESAIAEQHMGLLGMKQRVEWLGGALKLESSEDSGTHVTVRVPVASAA